MLYIHQPWRVQWISKCWDYYGKLYLCNQLSWVCLPPLLVAWFDTHTLQITHACRGRKSSRWNHRDWHKLADRVSTQHSIYAAESCIKFRYHLPQMTCPERNQCDDGDPSLFCKYQCRFDKVSTCVWYAVSHFKPPHIQVICFSWFLHIQNKNGYQNNVFFTRIKAFQPFFSFFTLVHLFKMGIKQAWEEKVLVHIVSPKTVEDEESKESYFIPGALVTTLFFLWGFSYGLLDTLNKHFQNVLGISKYLYHRQWKSQKTWLLGWSIATTETTYMQVAYFGAYFVTSPM